MKILVVIFLVSVLSFRLGLKSRPKPPNPHGEIWVYNEGELVFSCVMWRGMTDYQPSMSSYRVKFKPNKGLQ